MKALILFVLFLLISSAAHAEGQYIFGYFSAFFYIINYIIYTIILSFLILKIRKILNYENDKFAKVVTYLISMFFIIVFYVIDDFAFLPDFISF